MTFSNFKVARMLCPDNRYVALTSRTVTSTHHIHSTRHLFLIVFVLTQIVTFTSNLFLELSTCFPIVSSSYIDLQFSLLCLYVFTSIYKISCTFQFLPHFVLVLLEILEGKTLPLYLVKFMFSNICIKLFVSRFILLERGLVLYY